jgi:hypothetical protein
MARLLPLTEGLLPLLCPSMLHSEEVSFPKTINRKQYLDTNNFNSIAGLKQDPT